MKKVLALIIAVVMMFSVAVVPVSALTVGEAGSEVVDSFNEKDYITTIDNIIIFIETSIDAIHNLVGKIMAVVGEECAFCEQVHSLTADAE